MSKIEITKEQAARLEETWLKGGMTKVEAYGAVVNELVAMGLVRPATDDPMQRDGEAVWDAIEDRLKASDDLAARVAALEAKYAYLNGWVEDLEATIENAKAAPDPHAAAKERAKLWRVELVECEHDATWLFMTKTHILLYPAREWTTHWKSDHKTGYCAGFATPDHAWSNFPTVPPPGWEAPKGVTVNLPLGQHTVMVPFDQPPRTEADRLGEKARKGYHSRMEKYTPGELTLTPEMQWRDAALAVRKAVLARQLEPSEEEVKAALLCWRETLSTVAAMKDILAAAARVRLEKAEGEDK